MNWRTVNLSEVAQFDPPTPNHGTLSPGSTVDFLPMSGLSANCIVTEPTEKRTAREVASGFTYFNNGDVLVAKITPCFENGKAAEVRTSAPYAFGSTEFHVIRADRSQLLPRYLAHFVLQAWVRQAGERRMTGSAGQRRVPRSFLQELPIPIPAPEEQRRIATILDKADALVQKRRLALRKLESLAQSIFLEMFGDTSQSDIQMRSIAEIACPGENSIRTGPFGSQLLHSEFVDSGVSVLGIDNAVSNEFVWAHPRFITECKYKELTRYTVRPGDVLITLMGTCGRCAVVPDNIPVSINTKHLCCITVNRQICLPDFLQSYIAIHPFASRYFREVPRGAIMSGLNMGIIKKMPIPVPPLDRQRLFKRRKEAVQELKQLAKQSLRVQESAFLGVQHRAFRGEL